MVSFTKFLKSTDKCSRCFFNKYFIWLSNLKKKFLLLENVCSIIFQLYTQKEIVIHTCKDIPKALKVNYVYNYINETSKSAH